MAIVKNSINLGYGANKLVKSFIKIYKEVRSFVMEIDSLDASHEVITFDHTGATANSLTDAKTLLLCNEGKVGIELSFSASVITHAAPDTLGTILHYVKLMLAPGESISFPNGKMALYAADESICLGGKETFSAAVDGEMYVDSTVNLAEDLDGTETDVSVSDGDFFRAGDFIQIGTTVAAGVDKIEIMRVVTIATNVLTVERAVAGSTDSQSSVETTAAVNTANIHLPFYNAYYNFDKILRGSSQLPITDQRGRWKAYNLQNIGRSSVDISGIVPGSFSARFYSKAYQDISFANPITPSDTSNLTINTPYSFNITVADSAATTLLFTTSGNVTFKGSTGIIQTINNALDAAYKNSSHGLYGFKAACSLVAGQLRFTDGTNMHAHDGTNGSKLLLATAGSGTNLFSGTAGIFPATANLQASINPSISDLTVTDTVTGIETSNDAAFMIDDCNGNLIYPASGRTKVGRINYSTGEHEFKIATLPYASFEIQAVGNSGFSGTIKSNASTSGNHIHKIKARAINTRVNGFIGAYIFR
jgi:hypothetical protein